VDAAKHVGLTPRRSQSFRFETKFTVFSDLPLGSRMFDRPDPLLCMDYCGKVVKRGKI
jgi:hypothetical protein